MIDYDAFGGPPRRRRRGGGAGRTALLAAAAVAIPAILVLGHVITLGRPGSPQVAQSPLPTPAAATSAVTTPAPDLTLGACIDATGSIVSSFAPAIRDDLARAVAGLAPAAGTLPTNTLDGQGPVTEPGPGVDLTVRQVDTNSFSSAPDPSYLRNVTVPAVPGLAEQRPDPGAQDYLSQLRNWTAGYDTVAAARQAARAAATSAAASIAGMPFDRLGNSAISACISGLLTTVPRRGTHSYLLASDLEENMAPQLAGTFAGAPLVIIQTCDSGNAAFCLQLRQSFTQEMLGWDVGQITVVRPEDAMTAIALWIRTGQVTS